MSLDNDNWTREFRAWEFYRQRTDWYAVVPVLVIFAVVTWCVYHA